MAQNKKASAKFFCEHCGNEVKADARVCPKCGKFFSSVRCPKCAYMGTVRDFSNGCPRCHYSVTTDDVIADRGDDLDDGVNGSKLTGKNKKSRSRRVLGNGFSRSRSSYTSEAPAWVFVLSLSLLVGVLIFALFHFYSYS